MYNRVVSGILGTVRAIEFRNAWGGLNVALMQAIDIGWGLPTIGTIQDGAPDGINELQRVAVIGGPNGGTFTLTFNGATTAGIAHDASAANVQSALEGLGTIEAGDVSVTGNADGPWTVEFQGQLADTDVAQMTGDGSLLTGGSVFVETTQASEVGRNEFQQIELDPTPEGGTFTWTIDVGSGDETTAAIAYDAAASAVQAAIVALASFTAGDVTVSGSDGGPWTVEFEATFEKTDMALFVRDGSSLTGAGAQDLTYETTVRSQGPNHFDDPHNWTSERVPGAEDALFYNGGKVDCLYGIQQRVAFTADAGTDTLTFAELADFVEDQMVRLFTTNTLPAGLATETTYYIKNLDYDAATCQLSLTEGGVAVDLTDAGTGTHMIALHLTAITFHSRWTGNLGLRERNEADYYEYLPRSLAMFVDTITIGEGDGQSRLDLDTGNEPVTLIVHQTGGSNEAGLPAIRWKGNNNANIVTVHDGELGVAIYATETATISALVQHAGLVQIGTVSLAGLTKHGGELIAENATLTGALKLYA